MTQLIIAEKPSAAAKIAYALGDYTQKKKGKVSWYELPDKKIIVASAVGHLYGLAQVKKRAPYPTFEIEWRPTFETSKTSAFTKPYHAVLKQLASKADEFIVATDYDIEGEVIGLNVIRFICNQKDAKRMKFSTMTKMDLQKAYFNASKTIDWGQANAGETRHYLDWFYGINFSKAAMDSVRSVGRRATLSIGRVQGPSLAILASLEKEIAAFKPVPYWQIFADLNISRKKFRAIHKTDRFWKEPEAKQIFAKVKDKPAKVVALQKTTQKVLPPWPFDLTTLQTTSFRLFGISPKQTLQLAQDLYIKALISYPRTSSQKLPSALGFKNILTKLAKNPNYTGVANQVLRTSLKPNQGIKTDSAHPAIYPTGEVARGLDERQSKIYDLIVKRFFSVFGSPGARETTKIGLSIEQEPFILNGIRTTLLGWQAWYQPYVRSKEIELPPINKGDVFTQKSLLEAKETKPPARFSQSSLIRELEKRNLGTKATRASIIDTLMDRGYIQGAPLQVTSLGMQMIDTFSKYAPEIVSENLTRKFEQEMQNVREGKQKVQRVLNEAMEVITKICTEFRANKEAIGKELSTAAYETQKQQTTITLCAKCKKDHMRVIISKQTGKRFAACSGYPDCKTTWPLPQRGKLAITKTKCKECNTPKINIYKRGKRPWILCPNPDCPTKNEQSEKQ